MSDAINKESREIEITNYDPATPKTASEMRAHILGCKDLNVVKVEVPEWGGIALYMRPMTASDRDEFDMMQIMENEEGNVELNKFNLRASMLARCACIDPEGKERIFTSEDVEALGGKSAAAMERCLNVVRKMNNISKDDEEAIAKN
jgi:hypothetical protein